MSEAEIGLPAAAAADLPARARKEASRVLFAIAVLFACITALATVAPLVLGLHVGPRRLALGLAWASSPVVVFAGLGVWARFRPLPAAATGLALYVTLVLLTVVSAGAVGKEFVPHAVMAALLVKVIRTCLKARTV